MSSRMICDESISQSFKKSTLLFHVCPVYFLKGNIFVTILTNFFSPLPPGRRKIIPGNPRFYVLLPEKCPEIKLLRGNAVELKNLLFLKKQRKAMKKAILFSCILMAVAVVSNAQPPRIAIEVIIGNRPPAPNEVNLMRAEEARHPNITKAMHDIEASLRALHDAPDDFGGRKGQAENDLRAAYISLRKALYFRLYQDTH